MLMSQLCRLVVVSVVDIAEKSKSSIAVCDHRPLELADLLQVLFRRGFVRDVIHNGWENRESRLKVTIVFPKADGRREEGRAMETDLGTLARVSKHIYCSARQLLPSGTLLLDLLQLRY